VIPLDGTAGACCLALVDLSQYVVATRNLLTVRVDTETFGDVDQTMLYLFDRIGGALGVPDAARLGTVT
jgi:HK97 family phage major capsid protein